MNEDPLYNIAAYIAQQRWKYVWESKIGRRKILYTDIRYTWTTQTIIKMLLCSYLLHSTGFEIYLLCLWFQPFLEFESIFISVLHIHSVYSTAPTIYWSIWQNLSSSISTGRNWKRLVTDCCHLSCYNLEVISDLSKIIIQAQFYTGWSKTFLGIVQEIER